MANRHKLLAGVAGVAIVDLVLGVGFDTGKDEYVISILLGYIFAQVAIIAVWTALATHNWLWRFAGGLLTTCLVSWMFVGAAGDRDSETLMIALMILSLWPILVTPLLVMRVRFRWRIGWQDPEALKSSGGLSDNQFRIRQLLGATGCVAVVLAIIRAVVTANSRKLENEIEQFLLFGMLAFFIALVAMSVIWALLCDTWVIWLAAAGVCTALISAVEIWTLEAMQPGVDVEVIVLLNIFQFVALTVGIGSLRLLGIRLRR